MKERQYKMLEVQFVKRDRRKKNKSYSTKQRVTLRNDGGTDGIKSDKYKIKRETSAVHKDTGEV